MKLNKEGFTLIELLVVIAIIGILASIVLVSLNDARNKGYDTQIKSDIAQVRNTIELCYDNQNGTYTGCATLGSNGVANPTKPACAGNYTLTGTATTYAISAQLCSDSTKYWCVDNAGNTGIGTLTAQGGSCAP
ncbi:MAG: type II secretion system protein [Candidatus Pacebacteria bacterium]|nr:type II secretion system protein [Candidatus Paceibacterota bacterium]